MVTLYELLGVDENANKEVIKSAYDARIGHPALDDKRRNQMKIAVDILLNDEKRAKYNKDLADYRAQELLKNVTVSENSSSVSVQDFIQNTVEEAPAKEEANPAPQTVVEEVEKVEEPEEETDTQMEAIKSDIFGALEENRIREENMTEEERQKEIEEEQKRQAEARRLQELRAIEEKVNQKEYEKTLKKQEALNKKEMKKAEREYKEKYKEAYVTELRNRGYNVKYPWTWKRVKKLLIGIAAVILILFIAWQIPAVRDPLVELYNENVIVKSLVDVVKGLIDAIFGAFKSN